MTRTTINWTDEVWNPVTGCTKVSAGCKNCYAEGIAHRFWGDRKFTDVRTHEDRLSEPLRWRKPRKVFVNSMSDLFHDDVPDEFLDRVFAAMALAPQHTFQVLTKRPDRMRRYMSREVVGQAEGFSYGDRIAMVACEVLTSVPDRLGNAVARRNGFLKPKWPLPNVWLGTSVEDQRAADERISHLLSTPAAVRFLSVEPLLGPVVLEKIGRHWLGPASQARGMSDGIDWVIVGGESGPNARPCDVAWVRSIVQQCAAANVPYWVKQLGAKPVARDRWDMTEEQFVALDASEDGWSEADGAVVLRLRDRKGADMDEWPADIRCRELPR